MPSLSPLSTLRPWRTRAGMRGSVTTAWPSAASVGARTTARITASQSVSAPNVAAAATVPSAMVSGSPMPSRRSGTLTSPRRWRRSTREASQKSTSARVASASVRTAPLVLSRSIPSSTFGPTSRPTATNTIAGVIGEPSSRPRHRGDAEQRERHDGKRPPHGQCGGGGIVSTPGGSSAHTSRTRHGA